MKKALVTAAGVLVLCTSAQAGHSWSNYHWSITGLPLSLTIINSTTNDWDPYVAQALVDWNNDLYSPNNPVLNLSQTDGSTNNRTRRQCRGPSGGVRICNLDYGATGWLGIAGISISDGHITTGYTKLNDYYFSQSNYNQPNWKQSVTCQELGHNVGLGHQDEDFNNQSLFTCMDYQDPPTEPPNYHDFEQLHAMYSHTHSGDGGGDDGGTCNAPPGKGCNKKGATGNNGDIGWGRSLGRRGNHETFIRIDPDGTMHVTHVRWVDGH